MSGGQKWGMRSLGALHGSLVHSRRVQVLAELFASLIPAGHSVLDVGCGDGQIDALLLEQRPDLTITGVDVSMRPSARIPVTLFDGHHLPFSDRAWDTVLFCDVLHHTERPVDLLKEAARVARHRIVLKDHTQTGFGAGWVLRLMDYFGNAPHGVTLPYNYFSPAQWQQAFDECRLTPTEVHRELNLYPLWANWIFGRNLHFVGSYDVLQPLV